MSRRDYHSRPIAISVNDEIGSVSGLVMRPTEAIALYLFAHGAGAGMNHSFMQTISMLLAAEGVATLRFQFPYMEVGRKAPNPPRVLTKTIRAAYSVARDESSGLPLFAGGKSLGGRMTSTTVADGDLDDLRGLVFFGFPLHAPGKPSSKRAEHLTSVNVPMLFVQGTRDRLADMELLNQALKSVTADVTVAAVEQGDHSLRVPKRTGRGNDEVLADVASEVAHWIRRQL